MICNSAIIKPPVNWFLVSVQCNDSNILSTKAFKHGFYLLVTADVLFVGICFYVSNNVTHFLSIGLFYLSIISFTSINLSYRLSMSKMSGISKHSEVHWISSYIKSLFLRKDVFTALRKFDLAKLKLKPI